METEQKYTHAYNEKQVQILEATEELFAEHGYDGTSVRDIAHHAGVNVAMISYYFGSKEKLMEAMFTYRMAANRMSLENLVADKAMSPDEKLYQMIDDYVDRLSHNYCFHKIFIREQLTGNMNPSITRMIEQTKESNYRLIEKIVQEGQRKKVFVKHIDIPMLTATILGTISQLLQSTNFYRRLHSLEDMPEEEFKTYFKQTIKQYLKHIFQASFTYDKK